MGAPRPKPSANEEKLKASDKRIAARLVAAGELSPNDLESALSSFDGRVPLQDFLITKGYISAAMASRAVAEANGFQFVQLADIAPDPKALRMVGAEEAHRRQLLPASIEDGTLTVIMSDPNDVYTQDELRLRLGVKVKTLIAESDDRTREVVGQTLAALVHRFELDLLLEPTLAAAPARERASERMPRNGLRRRQSDQRCAPKARALAQARNEAACDRLRIGLSCESTHLAYDFFVRQSRVH